MSKNHGLALVSVEKEVDIVRSGCTVARSKSDVGRPILNETKVRI